MSHNVSIDELFSIEKGSLQSTKCTPGKYHFVVIVQADNPERVCIRKEGILPFTVSDSGSRGHIWAPLSRTAVTSVQNN